MAEVDLEHAIAYITGTESIIHEPEVDPARSVVTGYALGAASWGRIPVCVPLHWVSWQLTEASFEQ